MDDVSTLQIDLAVADMHVLLDHRKPGQSRHVTQRRESDTVRILSGRLRDTNDKMTFMSISSRF